MDILNRAPLSMPWDQRRPDGYDLIVIGVHQGLYIADGSIVPTAIGGNPFLMISALAEHIAEGLIATMGAVPAVVDHV